jgi:hypothetical protein
MKQYCVISAPVDTYSGYGSRARDFVKAIYELKKEDWQIEILSQRWGSTPWGYIKDHNDSWGFIEPLINKSGQLTRQPDVWIQITVPNEFQNVGKYSIGMTAGIETTICDPSWIDGINRMNVTYVSSKHSKDVFMSVGFNQQDQNGNVVRTVKVEKPIEVLFEGVDLNKYFEISDEDLEDTDLVNELDTIKEDFCYLFVGHWLHGDLGQDRKNVGGTIKLFLETFKDKKNKPALILKTSGAGSSIMDRDELLEKIDSIRKSVNSKNLPNVYLLHGDMEDYEINNLYNHPKVKSMIYFGHGEGYGRPLLEFSVIKKPIIASGWSGHLDFLSPEFSNLIAGEINQIHPSTVVPNILLAESSWFYISERDAARCMEDVFEKYDSHRERAKRQAYKNKSEFSLEKMKEKLSDLLSVIPKSQMLKLPQLKKIELPKLKPIS